VVDGGEEQRGVNDGLSSHRGGKIVGGTGGGASRRTEKITERKGAKAMPTRRRGRWRRKQNEGASNAGLGKIGVQSRLRGTC